MAKKQEARCAFVWKEIGLLVWEEGKVKTQTESTSWRYLVPLAHLPESAQNQYFHSTETVLTKIKSEHSLQQKFHLLQEQNNCFRLRGSNYRLLFPLGPLLINPKGRNIHHGTLTVEYQSITISNKYPKRQHLLIITGQGTSGQPCIL